MVILLLMPCCMGFLALLPSVFASSSVHGARRLKATSSSSSSSSSADTTVCPAYNPSFAQLLFLYSQVAQCVSPNYEEFLMEWDQATDEGILELTRRNKLYDPVVFTGVGPFFSEAIRATGGTLKNNDGQFSTISEVPEGESLVVAFRGTVRPQLDDPTTWPSALLDAEIELAPFPPPKSDGWKTKISTALSEGMDRFRNDENDDDTVLMHEGFRVRFPFLSYSFLKCYHNNIFSLSLSLSLTRTRTHARTLTRTYTNTHTHTFCNATYIHKDGYLSVRKAIREWVSESNVENENGVTNILITGHSLGSALATILAYDLSRYPLENKDLSITIMGFGQPRVGNFKFATEYNDLIPCHIRVAAYRDAVPDIFFQNDVAYNHVGREVYYYPPFNVEPDAHKDNGFFSFFSDLWESFVNGFRRLFGWIGRGSPSENDNKNHNKGDSMNSVNIYEDSSTWLYHVCAKPNLPETDQDPARVECESARGGPDCVGQEEPGCAPQCFQDSYNNTREILNLLEVWSQCINIHNHTRGYFGKPIGREEMCR